MSKCRERGTWRHCCNNIIKISNWTKTITFQTGKSEYDICDLCKREKETTYHTWFCKRLTEKRHELDVEIAEVDPKDFTPAMRHGVACALNADPRRTCWGCECKEEWRYKKQRP